VLLGLGLSLLGIPAFGTPAPTNYVVLELGLLQFVSSFMCLTIHNSRTVVWAKHKCWKRLPELSKLPVKKREQLHEVPDTQRVMAKTW